MTKVMLGAFSILFGLAGLVEAQQKQPPSRLDPSNTYAVIVGVLSWEEKSLTTYPVKARQDAALHQQLQKLGVPKENMILLLDKEAKRDAINKAVAEIASKAAKDSTLIVYYAGHGMTLEGEGIFACYDIRTRKMKETGWRLGQLAKSIKTNFKGDNVLLFADCCFSGMLADVANQVSEGEVCAASLTSASRTNVSTNNWTYTMSLIEALSGRPVVDADSDGFVTLSEAAKSVGQNMQYFERQQNGFSAGKLSNDFRFTKTQKKESTAEAETTDSKYEPGKFVAVNRSRGLEIARILRSRKSGTEFLVQYQKYNTRPEDWVDAKNIQLADAPALRNKLPTPLPEKDALKKASLDGKLTKLLKKISVPSDYSNYGTFHNYGPWASTSYAGRDNLPVGHWVYVYPHWYIWQTK